MPLLIKMGVWEMQVLVYLDQRLVWKIAEAQAQDCHLASAKIRGGQTEDYRLQTMIAALKIGRLQFERIVR